MGPLFWPSGGGRSAAFPILKPAYVAPPNSPIPNMADTDEQSDPPADPSDESI